MGKKKETEKKDPVVLPATVKASIEVVMQTGELHENCPVMLMVSSSGEGKPVVLDQCVVGTLMNNLTAAITLAAQVAEPVTISEDGEKDDNNEPEELGAVADGETDGVEIFDEEDADSWL